MFFARSKLLAVAFVILAISGCAEPVAKIANTPSGKPEAMFRNASLSNVSNKMVGICAQVGASIDVAENNRVVCRKTLEGSEAVTTQLLLGNSYSTAPVSVMSFTLVKMGRDVKAYVDQYSETIMALGQPRRVNTMGNANFNIMLQVFEKIGGDPYPF